MLQRVQHVAAAHDVGSDGLISLQSEHPVRREVQELHLVIRGGDHPLSGCPLHKQKVVVPAAASAICYSRTPLLLQLALQLAIVHVAIGET